MKKREEELERSTHSSVKYCKCRDQDHLSYLEVLSIYDLLLAESDRDVIHDFGSDHQHKNYFVSNGLPQQLVTDKRPSTLIEFAEFLRQSGIKHILMVPFHQSSNGTVERS